MIDAMETVEEKKMRRAYIPQALLQELVKGGSRVTVGIPRERDTKEKRLALTPEAVNRLVEGGYRVLVESGAGFGINYSDNHFSEAGAQVVDTPAELYRADLILKVLPPSLEEVALMKPHSFLMSMIQLNRFSQEAFEAMMMKRMTAVGHEILADETGDNPVQTAISEIEGAASIAIASEMLCNTQGGKGILLGGIPGVSPTEVVIIGAGHAGTIAARAALALGATVKIFDDDIKNLRTIQQTLGQTLFTSNFHPNVLRNAFQSADVVIGAMRYINAYRHYVVPESLVRRMKRGALIIDLRMSQGGCFETTCCLGQADPDLFEQFGILHYCKASISNRVARTASMAFSNIFVPLFEKMGTMGAPLNLVRSDAGFRSGVYLYHGRPVNSYVAGHFGLPSNDIGLYLSAF